MKADLDTEKEVIVIGGSYAGLAAAMSLGRALKQTLLIDSGTPCNRFTPHSHNLITQDGVPPAQIAEVARRQVAAYPAVQLLSDKVTSVTGSDGRFEVVTESDRRFIAGKILFATGIRDMLPDIPGLAECWGKSVIHCPYCHGYEYAHQRTGIIMNGDAAVHMGKLISNWTGQLTIFTNGYSTIPADITRKFLARQITINEQEIKEAEHTGGSLTALQLADGSRHELDAAYLRPPFEQHSPIPVQLGCQLNEQGYLVTDDFRRTTVPGIYAAGDNSSMMRSVAGAIAAGTSAGAFIVHDMVNAQFEAY